MQLVPLKCNSCESQLQIDLDNLQAYCPYCGQKLMIDFSQLGMVLREREKTKQTALREEQATRRVVLLEEQLRKREIARYAHESRENRRSVFSTHLPMLVGVLLLIGFALVIFVGDKNLNKKQANENSRLMEIESEIEQLIKKEDWTNALVKANQLRGEYKDYHWDTKREEYVAIIEQKIRELEIHDPDNIFMPLSSEDFKGKKYQDVIDELKAAGFTNIKTQVSAEKPGIFVRSDTVEHILVGGKTSFTNEDYFNKDAPIIVYYYSR